MKNIIEFPTNPRKNKASKLVFNATMHQEPDGSYFVDMEVGDMDDQEIYEAMLAMAFKFEDDHKVDGKIVVLDDNYNDGSPSECNPDD